MPSGDRTRPPAPGLLRVLLPLLGVLLLAGAPGPVAAQGASCEFLEGTANFNMITLSGGATISYLSRPRIGCPDGVRIVADSAITYSAQDMTHLLGSVVFRDGTRELRAQEARYFPSSGRLQASGEVRLENAEDGSIIENGDLVLLRETDFRDRDELTVTTGPDRVRPRATLFFRPGPDTAVVDTAGRPPADSLATPDTLAPAGDTVAAALADPDSLAADSAPALPDTVASAPPDTTPPTPYHVVADRLHLVGEGYFEAVGDAVIDRDSIHATARRAEYDEAVGHLLLQDRARVEGASYDLEGEEIIMDLPGGEIGKVTARRNGVLTGEDLLLLSPVIHLFLVDELLDRLVAVPMDPDAADSLAAGDSTLLARPVATAEDFILTADSLDVRAPGQELDRIWAVGSARGESSARDSLNVEALPEVARRDWMEGDTILATFRPSEPGPVAGPDGPGGTDAPEEGYALDELVASGSARSLYRLLPSDSTARPGQDPPAVHYVTGSRITISMLAGEVDRMDVEGPTQGYHLEPIRRGAAGDSVPDTLAAPGDTVPAPDTVGGMVRPRAPADGPKDSGEAPGQAAAAHPGSERGRWGR